METFYLIPQFPLGIPDRERLESRRMDQLAVLQQYADTGNLKTSLADNDRAIWSHYKWLRECPEYVKAYEKVRQYLGDKLEGAVYDRALNGVERVSVKDGQEVVNREYDVHREALMLKGLKPEVYNRKELAALSDGVNPERIITANFTVRLPEDGERGKAQDPLGSSIPALPAPADISAERDRPAD